MTKPRRLLIVLLLVLFSIVFYKAVDFVVFIFSPATEHKEEVIVEIPKGASFSAVTSILQSNNLVTNKRNFMILARIQKAYSKVKAGEFKFYYNMTPIQVIDVLVNGKPVSYSITVPEGYNMYQIAELLHAKGFVESSTDFVKLCQNKEFLKELGIEGATAEGYLYPDTYSFTRKTSAKEILKIMHSKYEATVAPLRAQIRSSGYSEYQVLTLASVVEKETGVPQERPLIASIFLNRLRKKMRLQSDPTTIYGMWQNYDGNITKKDLMEYSPYTTYKIFGLPAGPIASPGKDAINAVLNPERSNYLFFVSRNDGTHYFSVDYSEHEKAVREYQVKRSNRVGKSWRDFSKKPEAN